MATTPVSELKPPFLYDPLREIEVYIELPAPADLETATCNGSVDERRCLFLERVRGVVEEGLTEIACHPGLRVPDPRYRYQSDLEVAALCDARVREAVERGGVELITFAELG